MVREKYTQIFRRRREGKTNYRRRRGIILARKPFASIRISSKNVSVQIAKAEKDGDRVISSAHSRELGRYGWTASRKSIPTAYLTGFLAGVKAVSAGTVGANLYVGVKPFLKGSRRSAALKGLVDAGLVVPVGEDIFPDEERLSGGHVAKYAKSLLSKDTGVYRLTFSQLIKAGFKPEDYPKHFEETVNRVKSDFKVKVDG